MNIELLNIKAKVMIQKIDKLCLICNILFCNSESREVKSLEIIKEQYLQSCNKLIETGQYKKYKEVENIIIKEIAKVELGIDKYISENYEEIIKNNSKNIYQSSNYQNFTNIEQEIKHIETLKQALKLYSPYINEKEIKRMYNDIIGLKFNVLWRNQVQQLIYGNAQEKNVLTQYDSKEERKYFIEQLEKKIKSLTTSETATIKNDEILRVKPETILKDKNLLERLIIIDIKRNPYEYINLVKAKIFNAHLCNIANNPFFKKEVNYSLLNAILKSIITDENISIIECENLYKKFGFECRPILINDGQKCVKMVYDIVKDSKEYKKIIGKNKKKKTGEYAKIDFSELIYEFDDNVHEEEKFEKDLLNGRKVNINPKIEKTKLKIKKRTVNKEEENLQNEKEKVKKAGIITKDADVIILLNQDLIAKDNRILEKLKEEKELEEKKEKKNKKSKEEELLGEVKFVGGRFCVEPKRDIGDIKRDIERYEENIKIKENRIKDLEKMKKKNGRLTLEETKKLLVTIKSVYEESDIRYNPWNLLPLEDMLYQSNKVNTVEYPEKSEKNIWIAGYNLYGPIYRETTDYTRNLKALREKYQKEFKYLGIEVKEYCENRDKFDIYVSLDDISDLPIDYKKVKFLTKKQLKRILEIEERDDI